MERLQGEPVLGRWDDSFDLRDNLCFDARQSSMHDSQCVIPMMKKVSRGVRILYDLMDSAYDAPSIHCVSASFV